MLKKVEFARNLGGQDLGKNFFGRIYTTKRAGMLADGRALIYFVAENILDEGIVRAAHTQAPRNHGDYKVVEAHVASADLTEKGILLQEIFTTLGKELPVDGRQRVWFDPFSQTFESDNFLAPPTHGSTSL